MAGTAQKKRVKKASLWSVIKQDGKMDLTFFFLVTGLVVTGLVMLFSASAPYASNYYNNSYYFITRQLIFAVGGFILMIIVSKIDYHILKKLAWPITVISVLMLILVFSTCICKFKKNERNEIPVFFARYNLQLLCFNFS